MLTGEDLVIQLFFWTSAFLAVVEAVKAAGWRIGAFSGLAAILFLVGLGWGQLKEIYPPLTGWVTRVATNPQSWFLLVVLFFVLVAVTGRTKRLSGKNAHSGQAPDFDAINNSLQGLLARVGNLELLPAPPTAEAHDNLRTTVHSLLREHSALVEKTETLNNDITKNSAKIGMHDRSNLFVVDGLIQQLWHSLLFDSAPKLPDICALRDLNPRVMATDGTKADDYWREVRNLLSGTRWGYELSMIEHSAESTAEFTIRDIPLAERPSDIDPMDLRRFAILKFRAENTNGYIQRCKAEAQSTYRSCLSRLQEIKDEQKVAATGR
jgi:hypothetical protein